MSSHAGLRTQPLDPVVTLPPVRLGGVLPFALGAGLAAVALIAKGGASLGPATSTEIAVTLVGAGLAVIALLFGPTPQRRWGAATLGLLACLAGWTAVSISWSVNPADSWAEANRLVSYVAAFAGAVAIARLAPERGRAILVAVIVACLAVSFAAVFEKAFPAATNSTAVLARLREPLGYWNALGLIAAMAVPACLWLGARREGSPGARALAYPLLGLALVTLVFSYSRGALLTMAIGMGFWFAVVPLRLRGLVVLGAGVLGTAALSAWAFSQDALSEDRQPLHDRIAAGHGLALLLVLMLLLLLAAGVLAEHLRERYPITPEVRRRIALAALCAVALLPVAAVGAMALSNRGVVGTISQGWDSFFGTTTRKLTYGPERLAAINSKRGAYWGEAKTIWSHNKLEGSGAGGYATARLRYRKDALDVRHAHGYIPQTAADLGAVGVLISLAALVAWLLAARRSTRRPAKDDLQPAPARRQAREWPAAIAERLGGLDPARVVAGARAAYGRAGEPITLPGPVEVARIELLTLVAIVVIFGLHSAIDWTWAFPGTALVALVCGGYVAGHGPPASVAAPRSAAVPTRTAAAVATAVIAAVAAWMIWQPQRAQSAIESSTELLGSKRVGDAEVLARQAVDRDPVSADPRFQLATVQAAAKRPREGLLTLQQTVQMQPENPDVWHELANYQLGVMQSPTGAFQSLREALRRDPRSRTLRSEFVSTFRRLPRTTQGGRKGARKPAKRPLTGATAVAECRRTVAKLRTQLRSGSIPPAKAAKRRAKLARCEALIRRGG